MIDDRIIVFQPLSKIYMDNIPDDKPSGHTLEGLTRSLAEGDSAAWHLFHERYYLQLLRYAVQRSGNASTASEFVQDTYLRIARHAKPFTRESDFWGWLCCIVRCVVIDHSRHVKRRSLLMEKYAHWHASLSDAKDATHPSNNHSLTLINEALSNLPAEEADLLQRKYCEGRTIEEIASTLGLTAKAVEHRLARLRKKLREIILRIQ